MSHIAGFTAFARPAESRGRPPILQRGRVRYIGRMMSWLWPVLAAPFIGSFLGVLVARLPSGAPVLWSRSACERCGHVLGALDLVPIASWLALRGRCRYCGASISWLSIAIEIAAIAVAVWAVSVAAGWMLWASCALGWILLALAMIDFRDGILPDALTLPLLLLGLAVTYFADVSRLTDAALGAAAGFLLFASIRWLYQRLRAREGMGLGDAKLLAAAGAWVGWQGLPSVVLIATALALAAALVLALRGRRITGDLSLPFGPALCVGLWLVWLYGPIA
jgi:leader peptidase (prepilin peptidase) / N-methyltransferase